VRVKQSRNAAHADTEFLGYLLGCGARPVEVDHGLKICGGEAVTRTSPAPFESGPSSCLVSSDKTTATRWSCSCRSGQFE
jgi:hypothetical protein